MCVLFCCLTCLDTCLYGYSISLRTIFSMWMRSHAVGHVEQLITENIDSPPELVNAESDSEGDDDSVPDLVDVSIKL